MLRSNRTALDIRIVNLERAGLRALGKLVTLQHCIASDSEQNVRIGFADCRRESKLSCCRACRCQSRIGNIVLWRDYQAYLYNSTMYDPVLWRDGFANHELPLSFTEWKTHRWFRVLQVGCSMRAYPYGARMRLQVWLSRFRWKDPLSASGRTMSLPPDAIRIICRFLSRDSRLCMFMPDGLYLRRAYRLQPRSRSYCRLHDSCPPASRVVLRSRSTVRRRDRFSAPPREATTRRDLRSRLVSRSAAGMQEA